MSDTLTWREFLSHLSAGGASVSVLSGELNQAGELIAICTSGHPNLVHLRDRTSSHSTPGDDANVIQFMDTDDIERDPILEDFTDHRLPTFIHPEYQTALSAWLVKYWDDPYTSVLVPLIHPLHQREIWICVELTSPAIPSYSPAAQTRFFMISDVSIRL